MGTVLERLLAELTTVSGDVLLLDEEDVPLFDGTRLYSLRTGPLTLLLGRGPGEGTRPSRTPTFPPSLTRTRRAPT